MGNQDTISLLKECDSGTKMAVSSIDEVIDRVQNSGLRQILSASRAEHCSLGNEIHTMLCQYGCEGKDPNPFAKGMFWMKTNMKMEMHASDSSAADLVTSGCDMGVKSLYKYLNQYEQADHTAKGLCKKLISIEEKLCRDLHEYL